MAIIPFTRWSLFFVLIFLFLLHPPPARAAGIRISEASLAGLGTADALVADPSDFGALVYNPAAMIFQEGQNLSLGLILINPSLNTSPEGGTREADSDTRSIIPVPHLYYSHRLNEDWAWGLNVSSPFGLETDWPDETFPAFGELIPGDPSTSVDAFEPGLSKIQMININPNVAHRIRSLNASIAVGIDFYKVMEAVLDTQEIGIEGDGSGFGWNTAFIVVQGPLSFGLSYRSKVEVDIDGSLDARGILSTKSAAKTDVTFPDLLAVGLRYAVLPVLAFEFDVERVGWRHFDEFAITHSSQGIPSPYVEVSNWRNSTTYRLGTTYVVAPNVKVRFGYSLDLSPQRDSNFSARIPDANRQSFHTGFALDNDLWAIEGGYMFVKFEDRTISSSTPFLGGDPNGTAAYNGRYETSAHLFGLSFSWRM